MVPFILHCSPSNIVIIIPYFVKHSHARVLNCKGAGPSTSTGGFLSPISPYVLMEMRLGETPGMGGGMEGDATTDGTEDLKNKWGFTPGAEDTLDVSHGEYNAVGGPR